MSSSTGKQPVDELASHSSLAYDTVRSPPLPRDETPTESACGGYVTPVGKFPAAELDKHYQNIRHFKEIKPSFRSSKFRGKAIGPGRFPGAVAPVLPLKPASPSKESPASVVLHQNTPRVSTKTPGYAELRSTRSSISATSTGVPHATKPLNASKLDSPEPQRDSMGNAPTAHPRLKKAPPRPRLKPPVTHNPGTPSATRGSPEAASRPVRKDTSAAKASQALIEGPLGFRNPMPAPRPSTKLLTDIHSPDPALEEVLRQCQSAMDRYPAQAAEGRIIFATDRFACGMFDYRGGCLPVHDHKINLYVTPHAIVGDNPEPIFIYIHPDPPTDLLELEKGDKPVSPMIVCGQTGIKFSSDVVLSFPLEIKDQSPEGRCQVIVSEHTAPSKKPKQQVMDKILDCFLSTDDNRCTMMVNQLGSFTVVSRAPRKTHEFRDRYASQPSDEFVSFRVGVFGRQIAGTGSAQIRVIFWTDTDAETQRIVVEERKDRFRKLDRVRVAEISKYRKAVRVTATHVIPGWTLLTKDKERLPVECFISRHRRDGCLPSCTFALYRDAGGSGSSAQTPRVASCTIQVSQDGGYADEVEEDDSETLHFVAVVDEESTVPMMPPRPASVPRSHVSPPVPQRSHLNEKTASVTFTALLKPPAGLRHKILGELSLHLEVSAISGRGWKLLAQKMGLSAPHICCLRERYLCPGQALLNWYLGQQVALVPTREALRRLLDLFRDMDWPELETILMREIQNADNKDPGHDWSTTRPRVYEIIDDEISQVLKATGDKGTAKSSPGLQRKNQYQAPAERNRIPVPNPRSRHKPVIGRTDHTHQAKDEMLDTDNQTTDSRDAERPRKSPFHQTLHFTSSGSEKIISPSSSPQGYFYQPPLTQLPKPALWNTAHSALQHKQSQSSGVPIKSNPCQDTTKQGGFEQPPPVPLLPPNEDARDPATDEETPYLQPDFKYKVGPLRANEGPLCTALAEKRFNKELIPPTPPQRTTSVRMKGGRLRMPRRGSQENLTSQLSTVPDTLSAKDQSQYEQELDSEVVSEGPQVVPNQTSTAEKHPHFAASLQLKKKVLQDLLIKKLVKLTGKEEADPDVQHHGVSLEEPIPESIYDDVEILFQDDKDLEKMVQEGPGERLLERILQSTAVMGFLSKISHNTSRKQIPPFPDELKSTAASDDMACYEDIGGPVIPAVILHPSKEAESPGAAFKKPLPLPPTSTVNHTVMQDMHCYEDTSIPTGPPRSTSEVKVKSTSGDLKTICTFVPRTTVVPPKPEETYEVIPIAQEGAASWKPLPLPPTTVNHTVMQDMACYEDTSIPTAPSRRTSEKVKVKLTSGEMKTVRKYVPRTVEVPPKPDETYEVMPIGQGDVPRP